MTRKPAYPSDFDHVRHAINSHVAVVPWARLAGFAEFVRNQGGRIDLVMGLIDPDRHRTGFLAGINLAGAEIQAHAAWDTEDPQEVQAPEASQVADLLRFAAECPDDGILAVCCHGGIARSTALAIAALVQRHGAEYVSAAIREVQTQRPAAAPNRLILRHAGVHLGVGPDMVRACEADEHILLQYKISGRERWNGVHAALQGPKKRRA